MQPLIESTSDSLSDMRNASVVGKKHLVEGFLEFVEILAIEDGSKIRM